MHRSLDGKDVIDYSTGARKRDIQLSKEEDIEYRNGVLHHSSGDTMFKVKSKNTIEKAQNGQEKKFSDVFSARGSYTLDLQQCYTPTKQDGARRKRSLDDVMNRNRMSEERLTANFNISRNHNTIPGGFLGLQLLPLFPAPSPPPLPPKCHSQSNL